MGDLFDFPVKYIGFETNSTSSLDYTAIFQRQKDEFVEKITRQAVLARHVASLCWSCGEEQGGSITDWQFPIRPPRSARVEGAGQAVEKIVCADCGRDFLTAEMLQSKGIFLLLN